MKIAILVSGFPPEWLAGMEIATYNIAKYLARRGHEVHVITTLDEGLPKESIEEGFCVHRIKVHFKIPFLSIFLYFINVSFVVRQLHPDIVHSQSLSAGWMAFLIKKILKIPYAVYGRGSDIYTKYRFKKLILGLTLKNVDTMIALTEDMKKEIKKIYGRDVSVIPNGIDLEKFENLSREKARAKLQIKERETIVVFVGTLRPIKGLKYLIEAMKIIKQKKPDAKLMLVGDGEERGYLENLVKELDLEEYVNFVGKVLNEKVPEYMVTSDIFVLPSLSEGFPVTILEAMASGLPIVATKVGGLPEIVKDGENGFLVEPKNPEEIAEKVLLLLGDDELRKRILRSNKEKVKEYSWESVVERLENIYLDILA